jgi:hypothetical protein
MAVERSSSALNVKLGAIAPDLGLDADKRLLAVDAGTLLVKRDGLAPLFAHVARAQQVKPRAAWQAFTVVEREPAGQRVDAVYDLLVGAAVSRAREEVEQEVADVSEGAHHHASV